VKKSFYTDGLKFSCKRCSNCCRLSPGYVFISYNDLKNLAIATSLKEKEFINQYCRVVNIGAFERVSLIEKKNYDCIFWENGKGCIVYEHRPLQCRSFPFWNSNMDSYETWNTLSEYCPGINTGELIPKLKIDYWLEQKLLEKFIKVVNGEIIL